MYDAAAFDDEEGTPSDLSAYSAADFDEFLLVVAEEEQVAEMRGKYDHEKMRKTRKSFYSPEGIGAVEGGGEEEEGDEEAKGESDA